MRITTFTVHYEERGSAAADPLNGGRYLKVKAMDENLTIHEASIDAKGASNWNPPTPERLLSALVRLMTEGADAERD